MIEIIPNWHPIWVHFAVALLSTSAGLFLIFGWQSTRTAGRTNAVIVARWTLRLGVISAIGALITGYLASGSVTHDDVSHANMMVHRNWALAVTVIFTIITLIDYLRRNEARVSYFSILLLLAGGITLAIAGLKGAENVYKYGLGVQKLPDISTHEHAETAQHEDNQPSTDDPGSVTMDDGHSHSHPDAVTNINEEHTSRDMSHPASLIAAQLGDAISTGDIDLLRSIIAPDVLIFESGGMESSLTEYEGHHMPADMAFMKAMQREVVSRQVIDSGDMATVVTRSRVYGNYKDQDVDIKSTETLVMKKVTGQWEVVHIHWSSS